MSQLHNPHLDSLLIQCKQMLINMNSKLDVLLKKAPKDDNNKNLYQTPKKSNKMKQSTPSHKSEQMVDLQNRINSQIKKFTLVKQMYQKKNQNE